MSADTLHPSILRALGVVFAAGVAVAGWAGWSLWRTARRQRAGLVADGEVIRVLPLPRAADGPLFVTFVAFTDRDGVRHEARAGLGSSRAPYRLGERVRVGYAPEDPSRAEVVRESGLLMAVIALGCTIAIIAGVLLIAIGVAGMHIA